MTKLTKEAPQLYVSETGLKYYGIPRNAWFFIPYPEVRGWVEAKHNLDLSDEPWNQFAPGEHFSPGGNRPPLVFQSESRLKRSIMSDAKAAKYVSIGQIGEDGKTPFKGSIRFELSGAHQGDYRENPSGLVWLAPGDGDSSSDTIYISIQLSPDTLDDLCRELIARPQAMLHARVNFAYYQDEIDARHPRGPILIERDAQIPIIEAHVAVVDRPFGWTDPEEWDATGREEKGPDPLPAPPQVVVATSDNVAVVQRLNWAIGLLVLLVLVCLLR